MAYLYLKFPAPLKLRPFGAMQIGLIVIIIRITGLSF